MNSANLVIADSGSTDTLIRKSESNILKNITPHTGLTVKLPNGELIKSCAIGDLPISPSGDTISAYVFSDNILQHSLLSLSDLCNSGCTVVLTNTDIKINKGTNIIMHGTKQEHDKLWHIELDSRKNIIAETIDDNNSANTSIKAETDAEFVAFVHASFGCPLLHPFYQQPVKGIL